jgi:hypothetical protein
MGYGVCGSFAVFFRPGSKPVSLKLSICGWLHLRYRTKHQRRKAPQDGRCLRYLRRPRITLTGPLAHE